MSQQWKYFMQINVYFVFLMKLAAILISCWNIYLNKPRLNLKDINRNFNIFRQKNQNLKVINLKVIRYFKAVLFYLNYIFQVLYTCSKHLKIILLGTFNTFLVLVKCSNIYIYIIFYTNNINLINEIGLQFTTYNRSLYHWQQLLA